MSPSQTTSSSDTLNSSPTTVSPSAETEYLLVTEYFHPETASTGQLMTDLAVGLQERGLSMTVYTGQPNYRGGSNEKQPSKSIHRGVLVNRIRAPQFRQSSLPRRLFNWLVFTVWMTVVLLLRRSDAKTELVFVSNPPILPVALWFVCTVKRWEYTYISHDLYPDQPVELGYLSETGIATRIWDWLDNRAFRDAKHVVVLGPVMRDRVAENAGISPEEIDVIHNWQDESFITPLEKEENWFSEQHGLVDDFTLVYSGNIGEFHDLETIIDAAAQLDIDDVQFLIIGEGDNKQNIVRHAERSGISGDRVQFLPYQPYEDLPYSLTAGDASIVTVKQGFEGICVSSKLYTAMATGMPVLVVAQPHDDESRIVRDADAGLTVSQGDINGVIEAIDTWKYDPDLVEKQGENARKTFEMKFTKERAIDEYYAVLSG